MMQKNQSPVFSGNVPCYLVNQVFEYELGVKFIQQTSQKQKGVTNWVVKSPIYPLLEKLLAQTKKQFHDPALDIAR